MPLKTTRLAVGGEVALVAAMLPLLLFFAFCSSSKSTPKLKLKPHRFDVHEALLAAAPLSTLSPMQPQPYTRTHAHARCRLKKKNLENWVQFIRLLKKIIIYFTIHLHYYFSFLCNNNIYIKILIVKYS